MPVRNRIEVMHGVNLNMLGRRDPSQYGMHTLAELELRIDQFAKQLGLSPRFFQTNSEAEYIEHLHRLDGVADAIILNPGAWTHYAWAIHDALEIAALPAVEVHLSNIHAREPWRQVSVIEGLCLESIVGRGVEGYRDALTRLRDTLG